MNINDIPAFARKLIRYSLILILLIINLNHIKQAKAYEDWQWSKAKPADVGLNIDKLNRAHRAIRNEDYHLIDSMLVVRHGKLVYEKYYNEGFKTRAHSLASAGKSILSALVGISIDKNLISGVDRKLYDYFLNYYGSFSHWDKDKQAITIHDLLTMRAGWECNINRKDTRCGSLMKRDGRNATEALKWVLDRPMKYKPGEQMQYTDAIVSVLDIVVYLANEKPVQEVYQDSLFRSMGISDNYENKLTSRQMAMFGQLFLNRGIWEGKRIISEDWVERSTSNIYPFNRTKPSITQGYGYLWWIATFNSKTSGMSVDGYYAAGNGGQYIVVLPGVDMVIVFTGDNVGEFRRMGKTLGIVEKYVLPAIIDEPTNNK